MSNAFTLYCHTFDLNNNLNPPFLQRSNSKCMGMAIWPRLRRKSLLATQAPQVLGDKRTI